MPVVRGSSAPGNGVYAAVRERLEADARLHAERVAGWPTGEHPYPLQRVLDALRAGKPTDVPAWAVPKAAVAGQCTALGRRTGATGDATCLYRAIVHPDDTVTVEGDNGDAWLEDNGLL